ncbi:MAG: DUF6544 family protein [Acidobacteriota bacterium]
MDDARQPSGPGDDGGSQGRIGRLLVVGAALAGGLVAARHLGEARWRRRVAERTARLKAAAGASEPEALDAPKSGEILPEAVARYLAFAGVSEALDEVPERGPLRRARLRQRGMFRLLDPAKPSAAAWKRFEATQYMSAVPAAFVWDAAVHMAPAVTVRVCDGFVAGSGAMRAELAALVPLVDATPCAELDAGSLQRFLAEAVWLPTALQPSPTLRWSPLDDTPDEACVIGGIRPRARATLRSGDTEVTLDFTFDRRGAVIETRGLRYRDVRGRAVETPWVCRYFDWVSVGGVRVPRRGEAAWVLPDADGELTEQAYWRGRVVELEFDDYAV